MLLTHSNKIPQNKQTKNKPETSSVDTNMRAPSQGVSIMFLVNGNNSTIVNKTRGTVSFVLNKKAAIYVILENS